MDQKAIDAHAIPCCFVAWVDKSSHLCNFATLELNICPLHTLQFVLGSFNVPLKLHPIHKGAERLSVEPTIDFIDTDSLDFREEPHELLVSGEYKKIASAKEN